MHSNVMLRFVVQAFQDPPLCSSTLSTQDWLDKAKKTFHATVPLRSGCFIFIVM
jgi:hypothetical protein